MALRSAVPQRAMPYGQPAASRGLTAAVAVALIFVLTGLVFLGLMLRERNAAAGGVSAGGLSLQVQTASWVNMEHNDQDGFQMPQAMMPGAPTPDQARLAVEVSVENRGKAATLFSQDEFSVQGTDGQIYPLIGENLSDKHLTPGVGVVGSLTFDLPAATASHANAGMTLLWQRGGKVERIPVTVGAAAAHVHD